MVFFALPPSPRFSVTYVSLRICIFSNFHYSFFTILIHLHPDICYLGYQVMILHWVIDQAVRVSYQILVVFLYIETLIFNQSSLFSRFHYLFRRVPRHFHVPQPHNLFPHFLFSGYFQLCYTYAVPSVFQSVYPAYLKMLLLVWFSMVNSYRLSARRHISKRGHSFFNISANRLNDVSSQSCLLTTISSPNTVLASSTC